MENLEVRQVFNDIDDDNFNRMVKWMYDWWGIEDGDSLEEVKCYMKHSLQKDRLPQTYGLFLDNKIIGMYQFTYEDLSIRPDIYPWLANVYIDKEYRNKGYSKIMLNTVKTNALKSLNFNELYLFTEHIGLYEKFDFKYISELDTYKKKPRIQRLYSLDIKSN